MNINKIILLYITLIIISLGIFYKYKDIGIEPNITIAEGKNKIINKEANITKFDLKEYGIDKSQYSKLETYIAGFNKSSIVNIDSNGILYFATSNYDKDIEKQVLEAIKDVLKGFNANNVANNTYVLDFSPELLKGVIKDGYNFAINKNTNIFNIVTKQSNKSFSSEKLTEMFNKSTIDNFEIGKTYITEIPSPIGFSSIGGKMYPKNTLFEIKYVKKEYVPGFDINKDTYPVIYLEYQKKDGDGLLVNAYNSKKKERADIAYKNIGDLINSKDFLMTENEDKTNSNRTQSIFDFTSLQTPIEYYNIFLEHKGYKIIKQNKNFLLLENNEGYFVLFFDKERKYIYEKDKLPITTYLYNFDIIKYVIPTIFVTDNLYNKLNSDVINHNYPSIDKQMIKIFGNNIEL